MKGLVLEGGGVKGSYQVGAFYAFRDSKVKLDGFVGTSIGSFNAAMLASNKSSELLDFWYNVNPGELLGFDKKFIDAINNGDKNIESSPSCSCVKPERLRRSFKISPKLLESTI